MTLLLLLIALELEPVNTPGEFKDFRATQTTSGEIIGFSGEQLFHWNKEGVLKHTFSFNDRIIYALFHNSTYWVSLPRIVQIENGKSFLDGFSNFYDETGKELGIQESYAPYVNIVDGQLFAPLDAFLIRRHHSADFHPFLARHIHLQKEDGRLKIKDGDIRFFRLPALMRAHHLNYKKTWIVTDSLMTNHPGQFLKEGGQFWATWELEPRIYQYDKENIENELLNGRQVIPHVELDLPGFVPAPSELFKTNRPMPHSDYLREMRRDISQWSRILWFGKHSGAFALCYSLPGDNVFHPPTNIITLKRDLTIDKQKALEEGALVLGSHGGQITVLRGSKKGEQLHIELHRHSI